MDQFESKQQKVVQPAKTPAEPLTARTSKLNLNVPAPTSKSGNTERVKDPVQLSTGKRSSGGSAADQQLSQQLNADQAFLDNVTLVVRELLTHPVAAKPHENARLAQDRQRLEQGRDERKKADLQATRNQQGLDVDKQQQDRLRQQLKPSMAGERAVQGASQQEREQLKEHRSRLINQQIAREGAEKSAQDAVRTGEAVAEMANRGEASQSALSERNAARDVSPGTQDLVRGMGDGSKSNTESKLPHLSELSPGATLAVSLTTVTSNHPERVTEERHHEVFREQRAPQPNPEQVNEREELEEDELFDERIPSRRRITKRMLKRIQKRLQRKRKRLTPLERRKARIRYEKLKRMRSRRQRKERLLVFR